MTNKENPLLKIIWINGRINRTTFGFFFILIIFVFIFSIISISVKAEEFIPVLTFTPFIFIYLLLTLIIKRLHDLDKSGANMFFFLLFPSNIKLIFGLFFSKGTQWENKYGSPQQTLFSQKQKQPNNKYLNKENHSNTYKTDQKTHFFQKGKRPMDEHGQTTGFY